MLYISNIRLLIDHNVITHSLNSACPDSHRLPLVMALYNILIYRMITKGYPGLEKKRVCLFSSDSTTRVHRLYLALQPTRIHLNRYKLQEWQKKMKNHTLF